MGLTYRVGGTSWVYFNGLGLPRQPPTGGSTQEVDLGRGANVQLQHVYHCDATALRHYGTASKHAKTRRACVDLSVRT